MPAVQRLAVEQQLPSLCFFLSREGIHVLAEHHGRPQKCHEDCERAVSDLHSYDLIAAGKRISYLAFHSESRLEATQLLGLTASRESDILPASRTEAPMRRRLFLSFLVLLAVIVPPKTIHAQVVSPCRGVRVGF